MILSHKVDIAVFNCMNAVKIRMILCIIFVFSMFGCTASGGMGEAEYAVFAEKIEQNEENVTFYRSLYHCVQFMHEGKYESAKAYCGIAGNIRPDDQNYLTTSQMLNDEIANYEELGIPLEDSFANHLPAENKRKTNKKQKKTRDSQEDVKELCRQAVQAKIKKKNCESYKFYRKAIAIGGADAACTRNANQHMTNFKNECE